MYYFLFIALRRNSPVDLYTFLMISSVTNSFTAARDMLFIWYPDYFVELRIPKDTEKSIQLQIDIEALETEKKWRYMALTELGVCIMF